MTVSIDTGATIVASGVLCSPSRSYVMLIGLLATGTAADTATGAGGAATVLDGTDFATSDRGDGVGTDVRVAVDATGVGAIVDD